MQGRKQVKRNRQINPRQRLFCQYYLRYHSATRAYQKAYQCSYRNANHNSWYLMVNPKVHSYLSKLQAKVSHSEYMTTLDVIHMWAKAVYADMTDYASWGYRNGKNRIHLKNSNNVDGTLVQSIKNGHNGLEINLVDKNKALENLINVLPNPVKKNISDDTLVSAFKKGFNQDDSLRRQNQQLKAELNKAKVTSLRTRSAVNRSKLPGNKNHEKRVPMFWDKVVKHHQQNEARYRKQQRSKHDKHES